MMNEGNWIALNRKMLDNPIVTKDAEYFAVWIWLLLNAAYRPCDVLFNGVRMTLKSGQLVTSKNQIANALKIDSTKVQRILTTLQTALQIEQQPCSKNRLITIKNWSLYQNTAPQSAPHYEPQLHHDCTATAPLKEKKERKEEIYTLTQKCAGARESMADSGVIGFEPPTLEEVKAFVKARELGHVDAERFYNWFAASGWYRGRTRIIDWQAEALNWEKKEITEGRNRIPPKRAASSKNLEEREYSEKEFRDAIVPIDDISDDDL